MLNLDYPQLLQLFPQHLDPKRSESASFLIWYLENYYRLDAAESIEAVCDKSNDKGIDGIFVNDNDKTITVFQSKISQSSGRAIGDKPLREFAGTLTQFGTGGGVQNLIDTAAPEVARLIKRLDVLNKISTHELRGEFICNVDADANGEDFLKTTPNIFFVGKTRLNDTYISEKRDLPVHKPISFDVIGLSVAEYTVDADIKAVIAPVKATELVAMEGISNQSLFAYNVRGPLGFTGVNREIRDTIKDPSYHKMFPLFHNGITIIAKELTVTTDNVSISDYFVVNGCQSLTALYASSTSLTDNLRVLTKFIRLEPTSDWAKTVTKYSNKQNAVKDRDFMANDPKQIRLQNEFNTHYSGEYYFEIKRGDAKGAGKKISNEDAGLLLMAFDLKRPWATHRKYQIFEGEHYSNLFGRPEVTADRLIMLQVISEAIDSALPNIENQLLAKYVLTKYALVYFVRNVLEKDDLFPEVASNPRKFVREKGDRQRFLQCVSNIVGDIIEDLNDEVGEYGEDFDYRDKLRDEKWVSSISRTIVANHEKLIRRGKIQSFSQEWVAGATT